MPAKTLSRKQRDQQRLAEAKRIAKRAKHDAMLVRHAERRAAIELFHTAHNAWLAADCIGPRPIHPDDVSGHILSADAGTADLLAAAEDLGINLSE
jgi:hypothetical protein